MQTIKQFLAEGRDAPLYHGVREVRAIAPIVNNMELHPYTFQLARSLLKAPLLPIGEFERGEPTHRARLGISLTRSLRFAKNWSKSRDGVVFVLELDQAKLAQRYELIPLSFFKTWRKNPELAEAEEFLLTTQPIKVEPYLKRIWVSSFTIQYLEMRANIDGYLDWQVAANVLKKHPLVKTFSGKAYSSRYI